MLRCVTKWLYVQVVAVRRLHMRFDAARACQMCANACHDTYIHLEETRRLTGLAVNQVVKEMLAALPRHSKPVLVLH